MATTMELVTKADLLKFAGWIYEGVAENFVAKDGAKVLSTNDFTDALKEKLDGIVEATISEEEFKAAFKKAGDGE